VVVVVVVAGVDGGWWWWGWVGNWGRRKGSEVSGEAFGIGYWTGDPETGRKCQTGKRAHSLSGALVLPAAFPLGGMLSSLFRPRMAGWDFKCSQEFQVGQPLTVNGARGSFPELQQ
jgi:hypothetical protein